MRDFCAVAERDCIRLIVAQDLKENGIDLDSQQQHQHHSHHQQSQPHQSLQQSSSSKHQKDSTINKSNISTSHDTGDHEGARVFGLPLKSLEMVQLTHNDQILNIPVFLKYAVDYISQFIHIEGIFRRNGTASRLRELKKQVEEGQFNFSQFTIFDITSLVKLFFRELPESLLTFALYPHFIQAIKLDSSKTKLTILNLCLQLPDINLHVLIYIMQFLKEISEHECDNKMSSFNLAVCFAPNIIYTRLNKINELYINEEHEVIKFLIDNSALIGKVSDSVYERSLMLTSLCCSDSKDYLDAEQESFATARSTSLSSYCNNKKEKKKRRSSSLKELMTTIQNSISKFRRRSASEKNDKTSCSIMSANGGLADTSARCVDDTKLSLMGSSSGNHSQTPFAKSLLTPINTNLYTPRIKRNAEESLQSTTKKKLLEKLPQRNLLPNAPITPFSTAKKNKHPFKLLATELQSKETKFGTGSSNSGAQGSKESKDGSANTMPSISIVSSSISCAPILPQCIQTPATALLASNVASGPISATPLNVVNLQKQLKYEDSPSVLFAAAANSSINPIYDTSSIKSKLDKNHTISNGEISSSECRRRLEMNSEQQQQQQQQRHYHNHKHHHHHHHHHQQRFVNQSELYAMNASNLMPTGRPVHPSASFTSGTTTSSSSCDYNTSSNTSTSRVLTDSMRCTLKRGRPNTPKTGLSTEYRNRKSSVSTTPETHEKGESRIHKNDEMTSKKQMSSKAIDDDNLNTAIIQIDDDEPVVSSGGNGAQAASVDNPIYSNLDDLNDARLDESFNYDDEPDADDVNELEAAIDGDSKREESIEQLDDESNKENESEKALTTDDVEVKLSFKSKSFHCEHNLTSETFKLDENSLEEIKNGPKGKFNFTLPAEPSSSRDEPDGEEKMLNSLLRRQSLFKLKEKMSGRVSKQISEIEQRKLSPYRFCNSPLKKSSGNLFKVVSPVRVPSVFSKNITLKDQYVIKKLSKNDENSEVAAILPTDSSLLIKAASEFNKKKKSLTRCKSVKRLNRTQASPLSKSLNGSPITKSLIKSAALNCASESIDF